MTTRADLIRLSDEAKADAELAAGRGDAEGAKYAQGVRDAYANAALLVFGAPPQPLSCTCGNPCSAWNDGPCPPGCAHPACLACALGQDAAFRMRHIRFPTPPLEG